MLLKMAKFHFSLWLSRPQFHSLAAPLNLYWASQVVALVVKNQPTNAEDMRGAGSTPGSGRQPGRGNGNPFHYCCLDNPIDRGARQGHKESEMTEAT